MCLPSPGADADAAAGGGGADSSWACRVGEVFGLCHSSTNRIKIVSYMGHLVELFPKVPTLITCKLYLFTLDR